MLSSTKKKTIELLNYAQNTSKNILPFLEEKNLTQWLECLDEAPVIQSLIDQEIINSVFSQQDLNSNTESDEEEIKITHEEDLRSML